MVGHKIFLLNIEGKVINSASRDLEIKDAEHS